MGGDHASTGAPGSGPADGSILIAHQLRIHREATSQALALLRPDVMIQVVEPDQLDAVLQDTQPALVICTALSEVIQTRAPSWILVRPDPTACSVVCVAGELSLVHALDFERILAAADVAVRIVESY